MERRFTGPGYKAPLKFSECDNQAVMVHGLAIDFGRPLGHHATAQAHPRFPLPSVLIPDASPVMSLPLFANCISRLSAKFVPTVLPGNAVTTHHQSNQLP